MKVTGNATGAPKGAPILLQRKGHKGWATELSKRVHADHTYRFVLFPASAGEATYRVFLPAGVHYSYSASSTSIVTAYRWHLLTSLQWVASNTFGYGSDGVNGKTYPHSVIADYGNGSVDYDLKRACRTFTSVVGPDDTSDPASQIRFLVAADGAQLASDDVSYGEGPTITVSLQNHLRLHLSATKLTDAYANSVFGNAKILCSF